MLKKYCKLNKADYQVLFFFPLILWLLVFAGTLMVMALLKEKDVLVLIYSAFALFVPSMMMFVYSLACSRSCFDIVLSFSCTRKRALGLTLGHLLLSTGMTGLMALALFQLDSFLTPRVVAALVGAGSFHLIDQPGTGLAVEILTAPRWLFLLLPLAAVMVGLAAGTLVRRFGAKVGWLLYALFMALILSFNSDAPWLMNNLPAVIAGLALLAAVGFVWAVRELLRTSVKL